MGDYEYWSRSLRESAACSCNVSTKLLQFVDSAPCMFQTVPGGLEDLLAWVGAAFVRMAWKKEQDETRCKGVICMKWAPIVQLVHQRQKILTCRDLGEILDLVVQLVVHALNVGHNCRDVIVGCLLTGPILAQFCEGTARVLKYSDDVLLDLVQLLNARSRATTRHGQELPDFNGRPE